MPPLFNVLPPLQTALPRALSRTTIALAALVAIAISSGCPEDPRLTRAERPVATIDADTSIRPTTLLARLSRRGTPRVKEDQDRLDLARKALDGLIEEALLMRAATKANIELDEDAVNRAVQRSAGGYPDGAFAHSLHAEQLTLTDFREATRRRLTIEAYLKARVRERATVTSDEIEARYQKEITNQPHKEEVLVRQVFVKTEEEARHILGEIQARRLNLEDAARRYSTAPESKEGGALDWFAQGEMPEVFDACFKLKAGTISDVVASDYGFHIFEILARRAANAPVPIAIVRDRLRAELRRAKETIEIERIVRELKASAKIVINEDVLIATTAKLPPPPSAPDAGPGDAPSEPAETTAEDAGVALPPPNPLEPPPAPVPELAPKPAPKAAAPTPAPKAATPKPAIPKPAPKPVAKPAPKAAAPTPAPKAATPKPAAPKPAAPKPAAPKPAAPKPAAPKPAVPKPAPKAAPPPASPAPKPAAPAPKAAEAASGAKGATP